MMFAIKWSLCALVGVALAQSNQFTSPDGREDDLGVGDNLDIRWQAGWTGSGLRQTNVDLFVTGSKSGTFTSVLRRNISLDQPGNYRWKIDIPFDILRKDKDFVVAFVQARDPPNFDATAGIGTSSSRVFKVEEDSKSSSGSKGKGKNKKGKTKLGAILGGVLGGLALLIGALVTALAVLRSKRKKKQQLEAGKEIPPPPPVEQQKFASTAEMQAMRAGEHDAPPKYEPPAELQGSEARKDGEVTVKSGDITKDGEASRKDGEVTKDQK
ncbi:hypothetical protein HBH56_018840 [Parastagonospora nodorum]|uniref:Mid2 domain-containing protein n=2 Tax=Phaeosphaeria nodorum (strain SN15 / ATCC MYA-4574 / FGSC 10173) TaxID=321614 RepID=A0A7U2F2K8_PHANO|nr:hypothetical protein HBH56_018840 [Parastagonospora nodorum]QRC95299.1 hypothetical protein JI435_030020 [Parastagonospora nodorum SN15]KAH3937170.1 hypothetical protein HBH54_015650 [Parastagonospora nodorum]KAH3990276.1 hypothetical protein HBH52_004560 [Parastagonospora nodorum]KAH4137226.1 hypothetical protein HBH45_125140 [Parastagonospora nodorum]